MVEGAVMERLTKTYSDGTHGASDGLPCGENSYDYKNLLIERLGKYEDLDEQGRLIKLPCKVGDVVYVTESTLVEAMCVRIQLDGDRNGIWINAKEYPYDRWISFKAFGKTVFLTKSEAEAKLKELRGGE
jgi:hypothetical protein